jgi:hypothetical protein
MPGPTGAPTMLALFFLIVVVAFVLGRAIARRLGV